MLCRKHFCSEKFFKEIHRAEVEEDQAACYHGFIKQQDFTSILI